MSDGQRALEDVDHYGAPALWSVGSFLLPGVKVHELDVRLHADPCSEDPRLRETHLVVSTDDALDSFLTPDMAEAAGSRLIALGLAMQERARMARQVNAAAG
ncbi:hypothetical protein [Streptomyces sp. CC224B]|uniref:hypothetical protein n=1 Tax=Streptomyces sp. CC224B TaxID=3044571 RepID=UPI0024A877E9|nr:hypothetical protein [Streptomyces sp. CC224B]